MFAAATGLHGEASLKTCQAISGNAINLVVGPSMIAGVYAKVGAVRIFARKVEEVDAGEYGQETAEQGDGIDRIGGVEASEEDKGGHECESRECDIVERVDTVFVSA
jgi:hypothetical protein